ncbi:GTP-binding protein [Pisolithus marmoratus]|nr:GTP-binding protein [Pisolithus marmoratus]
MVNEYLKKIKHFRILVMGRANAGKTTILQRVCNSMDKPAIFDGQGNKVWTSECIQRGYHDIQHELVFRSNPGFVFHDSCRFEADSAQEFDQMRNFVTEHAVTMRVNERIHAIWFCIPMTDCHRTVTAGEQKFFKECDTQHVPVIVLVTKGDAMYVEAIQELEDEGLEIKEVPEIVVAKKEGELRDKCLGHVKHELDRCKFPPKGYVSLQRMHQQDADCTSLMECTANVLNEEGLQRLLISTQQSSIGICIKYAVDK